MIPRSLLRLTRPTPTLCLLVEDYCRRSMARLHKKLVVSSSACHCVVPQNVSRNAGAHEKTLEDFNGVSNEKSRSSENRGEPYANLSTVPPLNPKAELHSSLLSSFNTMSSQNSRIIRSGAIFSSEENIWSCVFSTDSKF